MIVRDPTDPVFTPTISPASGLIKVERVPGVPVGRVVFPDRALRVSLGRQSRGRLSRWALEATTHPLSFGDIRTPPFPMLLVPVALVQPVFLDRGVSGSHRGHQAVTEGLSRRER